MRPTFRQISCALLCAATLASCGCSKAPTGPSAGGHATVTVKVVKTGAGSPAPFRSTAMRTVAGAPVGEATPAPLEYFLTSLALCESLTTTGTAFS